MGLTECEYKAGAEWNADSTVEAKLEGHHMFASREERFMLTEDGAWRRWFGEFGMPPCRDPQ